MPLPYTVFTQTIIHLVYLAGSGGDTQDFKWREIEWGQKLKPKRIPAPKINPQKMPCRISEPLEFPEMNVCAVVSSAKSEVIIRGHKSLDCFEYQKNPYLNQVTPIFLQKKYRNRKFQTQNSFHHSRHLKSGVQPSPPGLFSCRKFCITIVSYLSKEKLETMAEQNFSE